MLLLTLRYIQHRLVRFVIVTAVASVVFALLFLMNGLVEQFHREPVDTTTSFRADGWVLAAGVAGPFTSASTLRTSEAARVDTAERSPVVIGRSTLHRRTSAREVIVVGHVPGGLVGDPQLLLADEPTANLDYIQAESVIGLLGELRADGRIIVVSSHDARLLPIADRVVEMAPTPPGTDRHTGTCQFHAGETIFEQGERAEFVYEIVSGEVDIVRVLTNGGEERLARMGAGRYFGELGPLLGFPRSATARAATEVTAVSYGVREFRSLIHGDASTR